MAYKHCPHCQQNRWGSASETHDTENTLTVSFHCSTCQMTSAETKVFKPKKWHKWIRKNWKIGELCTN